MFSIITPLDSNRLEQFKNTKKVYDDMPQEKEFIIPTRNEFPVARFLDDNKLMKDVKIIPYQHDRGFNPSMALNIGVRNSKYSNIIITSPEVKPTTNVLEQLEPLIGQNILCHVDDQSEEGNLTSLVHEGYRIDSPAMYFLAMFNKSDIEKINGWDEAFMAGYAYEDDDFGHRWNRAGLPWSYHDEIRALHQYHPRAETIKGGLSTNVNLLNKNDELNITYCAKGLVQ